MSAPIIEHTNGHGAPLYEQLAGEIARQIEAGTFRPGSRIPSVRETSRRRSVSVTTVLQAYQWLEDRHYIEARPQSGYYVLPRTAAALPEPDLSPRGCVPADVNISDLAMMMIRDSVNPNLVQFGAAIPASDLLPTDRLNRILAALARNGHLRQNISGAPEGATELRVQVAQRAFLSGCSLTPDDVVITAGCTEAVSLALRVTCRPGDLVAVESPAYFGLLQILQSQGLQALEIPTHPRTGISLDALRFALDHNRVSACLVVSNFSNPLGSCMPEANKRELVLMLAERGIPLIEDNIHGELYLGGQRPNVAKAYDREGLVMLCSSFSKDISPSYRLGWIAPGRFRDQIATLKMATNLGTSLMPQLAIAEFMAGGGYDHHLRRIRRAYAQRLGQMAQAVTRYFPAGTRTTEPAGGFLLWVQMPEQVDSLLLYRQAQDEGISVAPGVAFSTTPRYRNFVRLNAAQMCDETMPALQRVGALAAEQCG